MPRRKKSTRSRPSRRNRSEFFSDRRRQLSRAKGHPFVGRQLYDLAGAEAERRFSPYCWRTKLALMHKGLPFDTIPWRFTEKEVIAFSGQGRVPVLVDGDDVVFDSWTIATYLEDSYTDRPSLFGGDGGRAAARFVNAWADGMLVPGIARLIAADIFANVDAKDRAYF